MRSEESQIIVNCKLLIVNWLYCDKYKDVLHLEDVGHLSFKNRSRTINLLIVWLFLFNKTRNSFRQPIADCRLLTADSE